MRRHIIPLILLFAIFMGLVYAFLNTPWFLCWYVPRFVAQHVVAVRLESLQIGGQTFELPEKVTFREVRFTFEQQDGPVEVYVRNLSVPNLWTFFREKQQLEFSAEGVGVDFGRLHLADLKLKALMFFQGPRLQRLDGVFAGPEITWGPYALRALQGRVRQSRNTVQLFDLSAAAYQGEIKGQITLEGPPQANYVLWLEGFDLDPQALAGSGQTFFGQLTGRMNGSLRVLGTSEYVSLLSLNLTLKKGRILPGLAGQISVPDGAGGAASLPGPDGSLPVEQATLRLQNINGTRLGLSYSLLPDGDTREIKGSTERDLPEGLPSLIWPSTR